MISSIYRKSKEIVNEEKRRHFNTYVWGRDSVLCHRIQALGDRFSRVWQVIQSYCIHPSFPPGKLPNGRNPRKLFLRVEDLGEKALCFKTIHLWNIHRGDYKKETLRTSRDYLFTSPLAITLQRIFPESLQLHIFKQPQWCLGVT